MRKPTAAFILTLAAVAAVWAARRPGDDLTSGVPAYRVQGPAGAPVSLVVFSDFQCPACAFAEPLLKALVERRPGQVRVFFRHNPLQRVHRWAAAGAQGKFWPYHDLLFERQKDWSPGEDPMPFFLGYARDLGLDMTRFQRDVSEGRWDGALSADVKAARASNTTATPTVFINGRRLVGPAQIRDDGERVMQEVLR